jgi:hypothetical protein
LSRWSGGAAASLLQIKYVEFAAEYATIAFLSPKLREQR